METRYKPLTRATVDEVAHEILTAVGNDETQKAIAVGIALLARIGWEMVEQNKGVGVFRDCLLASINGKGK